MSKIKTKSIVYAFLILAIFIFSFAFTANVDAQFFTSPTPDVKSLEPKFADIEENSKAVAVVGRDFEANSVARWNGSPRPTTFIGPTHLLIHLSAADLRGGSEGYINVFNPVSATYSNAIKFTIKGYTGIETRSGKNNTSGNGEYSALASNAVYGSPGFLPSGILQWILFAIIILLIIIIVRKVLGLSEKYHHEPLKHA